MEVSSHGLDQGRANGIEFDVAVFTNLSQDHLDYHGSMDRYGQAKRKLFEFESLQCAVINADDPFGQELIDYCDSRGLRRITYGRHTADLVPSDLKLDTRGSRFSINLGSETCKISTRLLGDVNVPNVLAVAGALLALGWKLERIAPILAELEPPPGRMEVFRGDGNGPTVVVDYAHTPDALQRALASLQVLSPGRVFAVFGCGGDRDQDKRPKMGQIAQQHADVCIVTDDNPRTEPPRLIVDQILTGMTGDVQVIHDRVKAVRRAISMAEPDDVILLAGKGHEGYQNIGSEVLDLSDREFVTRLLEERR